MRWTSRLHLPTPLRSPGITPVPRYYGRSDSCPAWLAPLTDRAGLPRSQHTTFRTFRHQTPDARPASLLPSCAMQARGLLPRETSPLWRRLVRYIRPNRVRQPTDRSFSSPCSPRHLRVPQLGFDTGPESSCPGGDFHPADCVRSEAHAMPTLAWALGPRPRKRGQGTQRRAAPPIVASQPLPLDIGAGYGSNKRGGQRRDGARQSYRRADHGANPHRRGRH